MYVIFAAAKRMPGKKEACTGSNPSGAAEVSLKNYTEPLYSVGRLFNLPTGWEHHDNLQLISGLRKNRGLFLHERETYL